MQSYPVVLKIGLVLSRYSSSPEMGMNFSRKNTKATRVYRSLGFYEIPAYYDNPQPDACYLELRLR